MKLRLRNDSKSSIERSSLVDASNTLRKAEVANLLRDPDNQEELGRLIGFVVHPSNMATSSEGELTLDILDRVHDRYFSEVETRFSYSLEERQSILAVLAQIKLKQAQGVVKAMAAKFGLSKCRFLSERVGLSPGSLLKDLVVNSCANKN